jgi:rare lipoprotein A
MPSNLLGGSVYDVGVLPQNHHQQASAILRGKASIYPSVLNGHKTASGETFHLNGHTAASNRLPLGTDVKLVNLRNGRSTQVKVNDRGPALGNHRIDLSKKAANEIGLTRNEGTAPVEIKIMRKPANHNHRTSPDSTTDSIEAEN